MSSGEIDEPCGRSARRPVPFAPTRRRARLSRAAQAHHQAVLPRVAAAVARDCALKAAIMIAKTGKTERGPSPTARADRARRNYLMLACGSPPGTRGFTPTSTRSRAWPSAGLNSWRLRTATFGLSHRNRRRHVGGGLTHSNTIRRRAESGHAYSGVRGGLVWSRRGACGLVVLPRPGGPSCPGSARAGPARQPDAIQPPHVSPSHDAIGAPPGGDRAHRARVI